MSPTFETLPDEILMIIFRYSGDIYTIFRTYLGLNYRLNAILLDKRLNLFSDFLFISPCDSIFHIYYNSDGFQQISHQLIYRNSMITHEELHQYFQELIHIYVKE